MSGDKIKRARDALSKFIQTSHDSDEYFLIAFNSRAQLLLDKTRDGNAVLDKLTFVETKNQTALYDACYLGVEKVQRGVHPKRALLLISDGQDNDSRYTFNELRKLLKESDVVLYGIGILSGSDAGSSMGMEGQGVLDELSSVSGGKAFFPRSASEMTEIAEQLSLELRHQYTIGFKLSAPPDQQFHSIKVKVAPLVLKPPKKPLQLTARSKPNPKQITVHSAMPPRPTPANDAGPRRPTNAVSTTVITVNDKVETVIGQANDTSSRNNEPLENGREACRTDTGNLEENGAKCKKAAGPCGAAALTERELLANLRRGAALPRERMTARTGAWLASGESDDWGGSSSEGSSVERWRGRSNAFAPARNRLYTRLGKRQGRAKGQAAIASRLRLLARRV